MHIHLYVSEYKWEWQGLNNSTNYLQIYTESTYYVLPAAVFFIWQHHMYSVFQTIKIVHGANLQG